MIAITVESVITSVASYGKHHVVLIGGTTHRIYWDSADNRYTAALDDSHVERLILRDVITRFFASLMFIIEQ